MVHEKERSAEHTVEKHDGLKEKSLKEAIKELNQNGQDVKKVISCMDNDEAGNHFHERLSRLLKKGA
ncbi:toprim domain-containing protein [Alteribacillus bidgolensis]|uniref:toprim domain-containing protein n=1 Tax=Alteribacillus bidgolensis TaxID=930129 RepID=UPI000B84FFA4